MNKRIGYMMPDGSFRFVIPNYGLKDDDETEDEFIQRIIRKDVPNDMTPVVFDVDDLHTDPRFLTAHTVGGGKLGVDMTKARNVFRDDVRVRREAKMKALDVDYMRADEGGNAAEKGRIVSRKQALRDLPADPRIDSATSIDALLAIPMPELDT